MQLRGSITLARSERTQHYNLTQNLADSELPCLHISVRSIKFEA